MKTLSSGYEVRTCAGAIAYTTPELKLARRFVERSPLPNLTIEHVETYEQRRRIRAVPRQVFDFSIPPIPQGAPA